MSAGISIVTGANSGIGFETVIGLAEAGYTVVMACRNMEKAEEARAQILERVPGAQLNCMEVDLGRFNSVRAFADAFSQKYDRLDLLINNAGILDTAGQKNDSGHDLQFSTNYLGHFLLTSLLISMMPDSSKSRIVSLGSVAHKTARLRIDEKGHDTIWTVRGAYGQSKLACIMFADELDRRLKKSGKQILSLTAHPGGSGTGIFRDAPSYFMFLLKILSPLVIQPIPDAAKPTIHAALAEDVKGGDYYGPQGFLELKGEVGPAKKNLYAQDEEKGARLWEISEQLVGREFAV